MKYRYTYGYRPRPAEPSAVEVAVSIIGSIVVAMVFAAMAVAL